LSCVRPCHCSSRQAGRESAAPAARRAGAALTDPARLPGQIGQHVAVPLQCVNIIEKLVQAIHTADRHDRADAAQVGSQRRLAGDGDQRPQIPDQASDRQKAGDADQPGIFEDAQDFFHDPPY